MKRVSKILALLITCSFLVTVYWMPTQTEHTPVIDDPAVAYWVVKPFHEVELLYEPLHEYGYTPDQIKTAYHLPASGGSGATIAIIVAYDTPNILSYLATFSTEFGLPAPDNSNFEVHKMADSIDTSSQWTLEACLNVQWAHAIAPQAKILLVEAVEPTVEALCAAIDYATGRDDVVAVSMSWGLPEHPYFISYDHHFNVDSATFFAASGNNFAEVNWPAVCPDVVAVGGTTLDLESDGTVNFEVAWYKSGGGISEYEDMPAYQTGYGLTGDKRTVPDVCYNANSSTGYPVFSGAWSKVGGTSAGAPQWAAIYALDRSASHANLYQSAQTNYASSFRDITSGSNGYSAAVGYDYVTGLGSPITTNFDFALDATPNQGPGGGGITLSGTSFTAGSTVDIEYLNPQSSSWVPVVNDLAISTQDFTYATTAPDLQQSNLSGDNPPQYDDIVYRATDNSNGRTVTTAVPYKEYRRGLIQVGSAVASGVFGPSSDLSTPITGVDEQTFPITGKWFKPGSATLTLDGTESLGTATIDATGTFSVTVTASASIGETHTVTVNDGTGDFSFNLTFTAFIDPVPEGPEIAVFAAVFGALMFVLIIKRKER